MKNLNNIIIVVSVFVLINIIIQIIYFNLFENGNGIQWLTDLIKFISNFNFLGIIISPAALLIYSIVVLVAKEKYGILLLIINSLSCAMFFIS